MDHSIQMGSVSQTQVQLAYQGIVRYNLGKLPGRGQRSMHMYLASTNVPLLTPFFHTPKVITY